MALRSSFLASRTALSTAPFSARSASAWLTRMRSFRTRFHASRLGGAEDRVLFQHAEHLLEAFGGAGGVGGFELAHLDEGGPEVGLHLLLRHLIAPLGLVEKALIPLRGRIGGQHDRIDGQE